MCQADVIYGANSDESQSTQSWDPCCSLKVDLTNTKSILLVVGSELQRAVS